TSNLSQQILSTLFSSIDFERIIGPDSGYPPKPNPMSLLSCREGMGMGEQMLYIGDTEIDWQTAHRSADHVYLATWGYRGRQALMAYGIEERYLIDYPMELFSIVQKKEIGNEESNVVHSSTTDGRNALCCRYKGDKSSRPDYLGVVDLGPNDAGGEPADYHQL
ncbi:MAG: HAD-IA family hydrolase, partial [Sphaerochaeta sp.]